MGVLVSVQRPAGHQVRLVNRALLKMLDCSELEVVGRPLTSVFAEASMDAIGAWTKARAQRQGVPQLMVRLVDENQSVRVSASAFDLAGQPALLWLVRGGRDATRVALEQSERSFREIIESAPDAIGVGTRVGIAYANPAMCAMLGHASPRALLSTPFADHVHPEDVDVAKARMAKVFMGETFGEPFAVRVRRGDGSLAEVEFLGMHISWDGEPAALVIGRDLGERRALQAQLIRDDRFSAVGTLAAGVAHEINNPLSYTLLNLEFLSKEIAKGPPPASALPRLIERIDEARHGVDRVRSIVEDLEAFSGRAETQVLQPVPLMQVLASALRVASHELQGRATMVDEVGLETWVMADAGRLEQVFVNLLVNAAQALVPDEDRPGAICVTVHIVDDVEVRVDIADNGVGIAQEHLDKVFDPFFTTKPVGVGTGLGLPICHSIVTSIGGNVSVRSASGEGTVFSVTLPVTQPPAVSPSAAPSSRRTAASRARIIVIDDERPVAAMLERLLAPAHDVEVFTSGAEAHARLMQPPAVDLVLCDLLMPGMTGMDLYRALEREQPGMEKKIIFMTGGAFTTRAAEFLRSIDNVHVQKPFDVEKVLDLVAKAATSSGS